MWSEPFPIISHGSDTLEEHVALSVLDQAVDSDVVQHEVADSAEQDVGACLSTCPTDTAAVGVNMSHENSCPSDTSAARAEMSRSSSYPSDTSAVAEGAAGGGGVRGAANDQGQRSE